MEWTATNIAEAESGELADRWRVESDRAVFEVLVPPGPDVVARLARAVAERLGVPAADPPEPPRWRIDESSYSHGDLFELEQDTIWTVVDTLRGAPLWEFRGGTSHVLESGQWSAATGSHGCDEVILAPDGRHVLVRDGNEVTCRPLPEPAAAGLRTGG